MTELRLDEIQGNILRGYNPLRLPFTRFLFFRVDSAEAGRAFVGKLVDPVTSALEWDREQPLQTKLNVAFSHAGLEALGLPSRTLHGFPNEFVEGMRARAAILGDVGSSAPDRWDEVWRTERVHILVSLHSVSKQERARAAEEVCAVAAACGVQEAGAHQDAGAIHRDGKPTPLEHFGFTDGIGNPEVDGSRRVYVAGRGKWTNRGRWEPLAAGEFLLGYRDEAGGQPEAPLPAGFARNGSFMVYRKLYQDVRAFRDFLAGHAGNAPEAQERLAAKMVGRWRNGNPLVLSDSPDVPPLGPDRINDFLYSDDLARRCPVGAHVRRMNPRDALGHEGELSVRRRIIRRGRAYGPECDPDSDGGTDQDDRGLIFVAFCGSLRRQFEFVQQNWVDFGNEFGLGEGKDMIAGNHDGQGAAILHAETGECPRVYRGLPSFVQARGGEYFFTPSISALQSIGSGHVDPV